MSTLGPVACVNVSKDKLSDPSQARKQLARAQLTSDSDAPPAGAGSDQSERREDWVRPMGTQDSLSATYFPIGG